MKKELPREKLLRNGVKGLSLEELIQILLRTGSKNKPVTMLSDEVLQSLENIEDLKYLTPELLLQIKGIKNAKACQIIAGIELGKRVYLNKNRSKDTVITTPENIFNLCNDLAYLDQEKFVGVYLNAKNKVILKKTLFLGSVNESLVHPREIFFEAIKIKAVSFICVHNHPSGDVTPSKADIILTKRLIEVSSLVGIKCLDHIIIGDQKFLSLKEYGIFEK